MNELTVEWVEKAEGDYATAGREYRYAVRYRYPGESADKVVACVRADWGAAMPDEGSKVV